MAHSGGAIDAKRLSLLLESGRLLSQVMPLDQLLDRVMDETTRVLNASRSTLWLVDEKRDELYTKVAQDLSGIIRTPIDRGIAGHVARTNELVNLEDVYQDPRFSPATDRATGFRTRSMLSLPIRNQKGRTLGVIQVLNKHTGEPFDRADEAILTALAAQVAVSIENALLYEQIEQLFESFVYTIAFAIDARDPTTAGHSHRVAGYAVNLATALARFEPQEVKALRYASILHDVGKIGVREAVLCKRWILLDPELKLVRERLLRQRAELELESRRRDEEPDTARLEFLSRVVKIAQRRQQPTRLEDGEGEALAEARELELLTEREYRCLILERGNLIEDEWADMASHVAQSYSLLQQIPWPEPLARVPAIAGYHHKKLDGSGYPGELAADDIPYETRLLTISDIYDALTASDRPYKRSFTHDEARGILNDEARQNHVDSELVEAFFDKGCFELPPDVPRPPREPMPPKPI